MTTTEEIILVLGMMAVTFGVRYPTLALSGRMRMPSWLERALRFVPVAVLTAISVPMIVAPQGELAVSLSNPYLAASIVAVVVAAWRRQLLLTIVVGLVVFFAWRWIMISM